MSKKHSEVYWAVVIGSRPMYAPYFQVLCDPHQPRLYGTKQEAINGASEIPHADWRIVRVKVAEFTQTRRKR